jgi:hypothetical protein
VVHDASSTVWGEPQVMGKGIGNGNGRTPSSQTASSLWLIPRSSPFVCGTAQLQRRPRGSLTAGISCGPERKRGIGEGGTRDDGSYRQSTSEGE